MAATGPLQSAGFASGCCRGQDPSHRPPARARAAGLAQSLWERPWPRQGRRRSQASIQAAVGVKTPPTETRPTLRRQIGRIPCGSGLGRDRATAVRRLRCRLLSGSRPLPQKPGSAHGLGTIPVGAALAATGPLRFAGFDSGRCRGQDPSHRTLAQGQAVGLAHFPVGAALAATRLQQIDYLNPCRHRRSRFPRHERSTGALYSSADFTRGALI